MFFDLLEIYAIIYITKFQIKKINFLLRTSFLSVSHISLLSKEYSECTKFFYLFQALILSIKYHLLYVRVVVSAINELY